MRIAFSKAVDKYFNFLFILLMILALFFGLILVQQRQITKKRAASCSISFTEGFLSAGEWCKEGDNYQVLGSAGKFKLFWTCDVGISSFKVLNGTENISAKCKTDNLQNPACTSEGCFPLGSPNAVSGSVVCENLSAGTYEISLKFIY